MMHCPSPASVAKAHLIHVCANFSVVMSQIRISTRGARRIRQGHLWVYRSDVRDAGDADGGAIVRAVDEAGNFVGQAFYSDRSEIALRFLTTHEQVIDREWWRTQLHRCAESRAAIGRETNAYRLVYSEGDLLSSLTVDVYDGVVVLQTLSQGSEKLKNLLAELLSEEINARAVIERNDARVREFEGLELRSGLLAGDAVNDVEITQHGVRFVVSPLGGKRPARFWTSVRTIWPRAQWRAGERWIALPSTVVLRCTLHLRAKASWRLISRVMP